MKALKEKKKVEIKKSDLIIALELKEEDVEFIASVLHRFNLDEKTEYKKSLRIGNEITTQLWQQKATEEKRDRKEWK